MTNIVGVQKGKIIRTSTRFGRTRVGLERIFDVYSCRTQDLADIIKVIKLGATHSDIYLLVQGGESFDTYEDMLVEQVSYDNTEGGITKISVVYVGLFLDTKPAPLISIEPLDANNYLHISYQYTIRFVAKIGKPASQEEINFLYTFGNAKEINGTPIPSSPITPYQLPISLARDRIRSPYAFNMRWADGQPETYDVKEFTADGNVITKTYDRELAYYGFVRTGFSYERYGLFAEGIITISDGARLFAGNIEQTAANLPED